MTELSFLLDLLLNHKLPKATRNIIASRIREVEESRSAAKPSTIAAFERSLISGQAPSTIAAFEKHGIQLPTQAERTIKVENIAQTPATASAMASRQQAIAESLAGKVDKQTGRPRKF